MNEKQNSILLGFELCMFCADNIEYMTIMYRLTLLKDVQLLCVYIQYIRLHHV